MNTCTCNMKGTSNHNYTFSSINGLLAAPPAATPAAKKSLVHPLRNWIMKNEVLHQVKEEYNCGR